MTEENSLQERLAALETAFREIERDKQYKPGTLTINGQPHEQVVICRACDEWDTRPEYVRHKDWCPLHSPAQSSGRLSGPQDTSQE